MDEGAAPSPEDASVLWPLTGYILFLSSIAVGSGMIALMPELHRFTVESRGWLSSTQFAQMYTIGQLAPGPNFLSIVLIGHHAAGWKGALGVTAALVAPSVVVTLVLARFLRGGGSPRFRQTLRLGLAPIAAGMFAATTWVLLRAAGHDWRGWLLAAASIAFVLCTRRNPLFMIALGALAGLLGVLQ